MVNANVRLDLLEVALSSHGESRIRNNVVQDLSFYRQYMPAQWKASLDRRE